jgi:hypothetical protein
MLMNVSQETGSGEKQIGVTVRRYIDIIQKHIRPFSIAAGAR